MQLIVHDDEAELVMVLMMTLVKTLQHFSTALLGCCLPVDAHFQCKVNIINAAMGKFKIHVGVGYQDWKRAGLHVR